MTKVGGVACCGGKKVPTETHFQGELTKFLSEVRRQYVCSGVSSCRQAGRQAWLSCRLGVLSVHSVLLGMCTCMFPPRSPPKRG